MNNTFSVDLTFLSLIVFVNNTLFSLLTPSRLCKAGPHVWLLAICHRVHSRPMDHWGCFRKRRARERATTKWRTKNAGCIETFGTKKDFVFVPAWPNLGRPRPFALHTHTHLSPYCSQLDWNTPFFLDQEGWRLVKSQRWRWREKK